MTAANQPLTVEQGEYFSTSFTYETGSPAAAVIVAGWTAEFVVDNVNETVVTVTETPSADGQVLLDPTPAPPGASPNVTIVLSPVGTEKLGSSGRYRLTLTDPAQPDEPIRLMRGLLRVHTK